MLLFLSLGKGLVVLNISSSHSNTNLPIRQFYMEQFLVYGNFTCFITFTISLARIPHITLFTRTQII